MIPIGTLVIGDDCDAPVPRNVAVVVGKESAGLYRYRLRYVAKALARHGERRDGTWLAAQPTALADFGVVLAVDAGFVFTSAVGASHAAYCDGRPRAWQDRCGARVLLSGWALRRWATFTHGEAHLAAAASGVAA